jgi:hypothetical protein
MSPALSDLAALAERTAAERARALASAARARAALTDSRRLQVDSARLRLRRYALLVAARRAVPPGVLASHAEQAGAIAAMGSRAVIEQAKGVIVATSACTAEEAFAVLRTKSQRTNRKVRDVAADVVRRAADRRSAAS